MRILGTILVAGTLSSMADVPVNFGNAALSPVRLVYASYGVPLVRTTASGATLPVAQLLYRFAGVWPPEWKGAGSVAAFNTEASGTPGTWVGGSRMLPGVAAGQHVVLSVLVWDANRTKNWKVAMAGQRQLFVYTGDN